VHELLPVPDATLPGGVEVQPAAPVSVLKVPAGHGVAAELPVLAS
jgi:hypothetical protein